MRRGLRAALLLTPVVFGTRLSEGFEAPKAELVRILGLGLLAAVIARPRELMPMLRRPAGICLAVWAASEVLLTVFSTAPLLSVFGERDQLEGLITSLALAGIFLAACDTCSEPGEARASIDAWLLGTAIACGYAFLQLLGLDPVSWTGTATLEGRIRPFGTMGHANLLGAAAAAAAAATLARALTEAPRRTLHAIAAVVFAAATMVTLSRAAWLGLAAGGTTAAVLAWRTPRKGIAPGRVALIAAAAAVALVALALVTGLGETVVARARDLVSPEGSGRSRLEIWRTALGAWRARPWLGHGPDTFELVGSRFQTPEYWRFEWSGVSAHAHSIYLHVLATRGLIGFAAAAALAVAVAMAALRAWRSGGEGRVVIASHAAPLAALAMAGAFGALGITGATMVAALMGALASMGAEGEPAPKAARRAAPPTARPARAASAATIAGIGVALAASVLAANDLIANRAMGTSRGAVEPITGKESEAPLARLEIATERCREAMTRLPWDDTGARLLCGVLLARASSTLDPRPLLEDAEGVAREAVRRMPLRSVNHERMAQVLEARARLGDATAAVACDSAFARASALAPYDATILGEWARARVALGSAREALEPARRAAELYPDRPLTQGILAEAAMAAGDSAQAIEAMRRAIDARRREQAAQAR